MYFLRHAVPGRSQFSPELLMLDGLDPTVKLVLLNEQIETNTANGKDFDRQSMQ